MRIRKRRRRRDGRLLLLLLQLLLRKRRRRRDGRLLLLLLLLLLLHSCRIFPPAPLGGPGAASRVLSGSSRSGLFLFCFSLCRRRRPRRRRTTTASAPPLQPLRDLKRLFSCRSWARAFGGVESQSLGGRAQRRRRRFQEPRAAPSFASSASPSPCGEDRERCFEGSRSRRRRLFRDGRGAVAAEDCERGARSDIDGWRGGFRVVRSPDLGEGGSTLRLVGCT